MAGKLRLHIDEVRYGAHTVLRAVDIEVDRSSIVTLLGANGSGKTSAVRALSGLIPFSGYVEVAGERVSPLTPERVARHGILQVPEGRGLFGPMTVLENLLIGAYLRGERAAIQRDLDWVYALFPRLRERAQQPAGLLSGGEQQMLAIGRGIASAPRLMLLDEPSMGLAPAIADLIFDRVASLHRESGVTLLLVEQRVAEALESCDYGYVLETGTVVLQGPHTALMADERVRRAYLGM